MMKEKELASTEWTDFGPAVVCVKRIINKAGRDTACILFRVKRGALIKVNAEIEESGTHMVGIVGRKVRR
jgi:hypothetical protein